MSYTTEVYGASIDPATHASLATREGVFAKLAAQPDANARTLDGVGLVAHGHDLDYARAWLAQASAFAAQVESRRARMDNEPITDDECASLYRAIGNFFRAINVCPYGWKRLRWRMEDLLGAPRNKEERGFAGLDVSDISDAESEEAILRGITWRRRRQTVGDRTVSWFDQRDMGWLERESYTIVEEGRFGGGSTTTQYARAPKFAPGVWRRSVTALMLRATPTQVASWESSHSMSGTTIYFGRPSDIGVEPPGVGDVHGGIPEDLAAWDRLPTGENHRVWLMNDGRVFRQPNANTLQPFSALQVLDINGLPNGGSMWQLMNTGDQPNSIVDRIANAGAPGNRQYMDELRQVPLADLPPSADLPEPDGRTPRQVLATVMPVSPVVAPAEWYWQVFTAPVEGLRAPGSSEDVSLLDYIRIMGPAEMIREILRDTVARNLALMTSRGFSREAQLFGEARRADLDSAARGASQIVEQGQALRTTQATFGVLTTVASAIPVVGPIAGAIVGGAGLVGMAIAESTRNKSSQDTVTVDVFGRMTPAWERFEIIGNRASLVTAMSLPEMQPLGGVRTREAREAAARDLAQQMAEFGAAQYTLDSAALRESTLTPNRATGVRTVVLYGLDPTGGARVYANDSTDRELTLTPQETGMPARWQSSNEYGPVWVFGAPVGVTRIRVVYPDGGWRTIALPAAEEDPMNPQRTPQERTAFVDATPPTSEAPQSVTTQPVGENRSAQFPPRTVVLVGMQPGTRVFAQGDDITNLPMLTGDAARWIESTLPGVQGWSFGVPLDNTRALDLLLPDGTRRSIALAPLPANASLTDRVTVIDLTGSSAAGRYPSRTVVLVGMPEGSRVFKGGEDITNIPMLTGDAARWIESTLPGVQGWSFGVPDGTRVLEVVTPSGQRIPVTLPPMDPALAIEAKVTVVDLRAFLAADPSQASTGGGGGALLLVGLAAAVAAGRYYFKDR